MRPLPVIDPALHRALRTIESAQGPKVILDGREVLLLCSNDYLGLAGDQRVRDAAAEFAARWGAGAGASPLVSGHMAPHRELEPRLAELKGTEACVLFGSGLPRQHGRDRGARDRRRRRLRRAEPRLDRRRLPARASADARISARRGSRRGADVIVTDAVFSMDGDVARCSAGRDRRAGDRRRGARDRRDRADGRGLVHELGLAGRRDHDRHAGQGARALRRVRLLRARRPPTSSSTARAR